MATEIERKFLVIGDAWKAATPVLICQGYLSRRQDHVVRIRIVQDSAFLTIKGVSSGASRPEFEYPIPLEDAKRLLEFCDQPPITKHRRHILVDGLALDVDEFLGNNAGLVIAEVELESEDQDISLPEWVGEEVTCDARYFNSNLNQHPFNSWT